VVSRLIGITANFDVSVIDKSEPESCESVEVEGHFKMNGKEITVAIEEPGNDQTNNAQ